FLWRRPPHSAADLVPYTFPRTRADACRCSAGGVYAAGPELRTNCLAYQMTRKTRRSFPNFKSSRKWWSGFERRYWITDAGGVVDISRWCKPPVTHTRYDKPRQGRRNVVVRFPPPRPRGLDYC